MTTPAVPFVAVGNSVLDNLGLKYKLYGLRFAYHIPRGTQARHNGIQLYGLYSEIWGSTRQ